MFNEIVTKDGLKFNDLEKKIYKLLFAKVNSSFD